MDNSERDERDEAIVSARIEGTSTRALATRFGCTGREIEEAIDRRLNYELDARQKLRLIKLSVGRIEALLALFFERATKDKDVSAGTLCCKLEERLSMLLGLDVPLQSRVDIYAVERQQGPTEHNEIKAAIMRMARPERYASADGIDGNGAADGENHENPDAGSGT